MHSSASCAAPDHVPTGLPPDPGRLADAGSRRFGVSGGSIPCRRTGVCSPSGKDITLDKQLIYLFDPLCGWCYGVSKNLDEVVAHIDMPLVPVPTGLFAGDGARSPDAGLVSFLWDSDQRIARVTGQNFSVRYRERVLGSRHLLLDSGPATMALVAVHLVEPSKVYDALKAIQHARYIDGLDVTSQDALAEILDRHGLPDVARRLAQPDDALLQATSARVAEGKRLLKTVGMGSVPTFVLSTQGQHHLLQASALFTSPELFLRVLARVDG